MDRDAVDPATFRRALAWAVALPLALMALLAGVFLWQVGRLLAASERVAHADRVIARAQDALKRLVDMETGLRGYLVTGRREFLEPYDAAAGRIDRELEDLGRMVEGDEAQARQLDELRRVAGGWRRYARDLIALRGRGGQEYRDYEVNARGKRLMDGLRGRVAAVVAAEARRRDDLARAERGLARVVVATVVAASLLLGAVIALFDRRKLVALSRAYATARERAERRDQERFRLMVEAVRDYAIFQLDPQGRVATWNAGAERIKGYNAAEVLGQHFARFYPEEDVERGKPDQALRAAATAGRFEEEAWRVRKDGSRFYAHVVLTALRDEERGLLGFTKVTRDITERMRRDEAEALLASEERFRATFEQAAVGLAHLAPDGRWLLVNQRLCAIVGYPRAELLKKTFQEITHPEDLDADLRQVGRLLAGEIDTYELEKRYLRGDGAVVWVNLTVSLVREPTGAAKYFISAVEDISARKRDEEALRRYAQRLRALHEADRAILQARSPAEIAGAALGSLSRAIPCRHLEVALFDPERRQAVVLAARDRDGGDERAEAGPIPLEDFGDLEGLRPGQAPIIVDDSRGPEPPRALGRRLLARGPRSLMRVPLVIQEQVIGTLDLAGCDPGALGPEQGQMARELADLLAIAIQQSRLHEQLARHAEQLEATVQRRTRELREAVAGLETFTYSASHDLRAPLRAVHGLTQALLEDYGERLDPTGQDYARRIVAAARRMDALIQDLLAYSRLSLADIRVQPLDLDAIVAEALTGLEAELRERRAEVVVERPLPPARGQRIILAQVLQNLLSNAIKFTEPGARPRVRVWAEPRDRWVRLWVEDNGIGIAPEHHERIFRIFERLHGGEAYPGTGVGLAIVQKGAERMGGRAGVESEPGRGSRFWIELPTTATEDEA